MAGELPRQAHNAPLHLFSASPELIGFGQGAYRRRPENTSLLLGQLLERFREEGFTMSYTMEDFKRDYFKEHFPRLTRAERREILESLPQAERREILKSLPQAEQEEFLQALPPERRLAGLSAEQIRRYLEQLTAGPPAPRRKPRRKK